MAQSMIYVTNGIVLYCIRVHFLIQTFFIIRNPQAYVINDIDDMVDTVA